MKAAMRAAVSTTYGGPETVRVIEVDRPEPGPVDVLVKVQFGTVNRTDAAYRRGVPKAARVVYGLRGPRVSILGCEFAGVIHAIGTEVTRFSVGDRVFGYNEGPFGAHAEYLALPQTAPIAKIPDGVSLKHAAASTEGTHYAMPILRKAKVEAGQDVLVNGATGGIGSAAVQLLHDLGANVTGVCATPHLDLVRSLGADRVIDFTAEDFTASDFSALDLSGDQRKYDVVIDSVGKSTFGKCKPLLKDHGIYVSSELGPWVQNPVLALVTPLMPAKLGRGNRVIFPIPTHNQGIVEHIAGLLASGAVTPVIDREYPLAQISDAYRYVESGQKIGNVLLAIGTD